MKKLTLFIAMCLLSGCALFGEEEALPLYTLTTERIEPGSALSESLAIDVPLSEASLDTPRIALTPSPYQRDYLANGQWPERLPKTLQEVFLESFSQRWGGIHVNRVSSGLQTTYILQSEIQDFSVHDLYGNTPNVRLKIVFKIIDLQNRNVLAAQQFCETSPIPSTTMKGIVEAFNRGLHCLLEKAIPWMEAVFLKKSRLSS